MDVIQWKPEENGKGEPPVTASPEIKKTDTGVILSSETEGASIGYRVFDGAIQDTIIRREIKTWDFFYLMPRGGETTVEVPMPWQVYTGGTIPLKKGQTILVNAQRIGYRPTEASFKMR